MIDRLTMIKDLREEADRLEAEHFAMRPLPEKWEVGMKVRYLESKEFSWTKGTESIIWKLDPQFKNRKASEYQVFWTSNDKGKTSFWTTPEDVELVLV